MDIFKPCPFCGGSAHIEHASGRKGEFAWSQCDICGARSRNRRWNSPEDNAFIIGLWNNRTGDKRPEGETHGTEGNNPVC
ncbi:MAG: Lar family restriction alleviation protein [Oscillospiraceae bacterium]|nr:Lar family restriction alleviation protein [Oscillospiraceae bacterium]